MPERAVLSFGDVAGQVSFVMIFFFPSESFMCLALLLFNSFHLLFLLCLCAQTCYEEKPSACCGLLEALFSSVLFILRGKEHKLDFRNVITGSYEDFLRDYLTFQIMCSIFFFLNQDPSSKNQAKICNLS